MINLLELLSEVLHSEYLTWCDWLLARAGFNFHQIFLLTDCTQATTERIIGGNSSLTHNQHRQMKGLTVACVSGNSAIVSRLVQVTRPKETSFLLCRLTLVITVSICITLITFQSWKLEIYVLLWEGASIVVCREKPKHLVLALL